MISKIIGLQFDDAGVRQLRCDCILMELICNKFNGTHHINLKMLKLLFS